MGPDPVLTTFLALTQPAGQVQGDLSEARVEAHYLAASQKFVGCWVFSLAQFVVQGVGWSRDPCLTWKPCLSIYPNHFKPHLSFQARGPGFGAPNPARVMPFGNTLINSGEFRETSMCFPACSPHPLLLTAPRISTVFPLWRIKRSVPN